MGRAAPDILTLLPHPAQDANKYTRGQLLLIGGSERYPGAVCLAAHAAQRCGAGYVRAYCAPQTAPILVGRHPSVVAAPWDGLRGAYLPDSAEKKPVAYVVGPGMDVADAKQAALALKVLAGAKAPVLVDGGALGALATGEGRLAAKLRVEAGLPTVLTPHGGEAARLARAVRLDVRELSADPERFASALSRAYGAVVALKGPDTWIAQGERVVCVSEGTAALAKAGTGDVLAGAIGAFLAQGLDAFDAAYLGVVLHAHAGCAAEAELTDIAVTPEDVIAHIPRVLKAWGC